MRKLTKAIFFYPSRLRGRLKRNLRRQSSRTTPMSARSAGRRHITRLANGNREALLRSIAKDARLFVNSVSTSLLMNPSFVGTASARKS